MNTTPLEDLTFTQIYTVFHVLMNEDFLDMSAVEVGLVTYYSFEVYGDHEIPFRPNLSVEVKRGTHTLIHDPRTDQWIAYQGPGNGD